MQLLRKLLQEIELANRRYRLFERNDALILAVSGGPDSMALLALLSKLRQKYRFKIVVAHMNHGLLERESANYLALVKKISSQFGYPFYSKTIRLRALAKKNKRSLEEMGRLERYRFFEKVAKKTTSDKIVTAHTLDDQAETMLLRILRGSGLRGLGGIPCKRKQGRFDVIRPLLFSEKSDLVAFLKENRIPFYEDKTNRSLVFTRNRVRHALLPSLARLFNPQIKSSLSSLQTICQETQDYIDAVASRAFKNYLQTQPTRQRRTVSLRLLNLKRLHPAILREVLFKALFERKGDLKRFSYSHIAGIVDLLNSRQHDLELHLPGRIKVRKTKKTLHIL